MLQQETLNIWMRTNQIDVSLRMSFPINKKDKNGVIYSKQAVENALKNATARLPIVFRANEDDRIIGITTSKPYAILHAKDGQYIEYTVDGKIFVGGTEETVEINNGVVDSMNIVSIGMSM